MRQAAYAPAPAPAPVPFFREAGKGPGVVCLHANASTSGQWRSLMDLLAPRFHVLAPDMYDEGRSPGWPSDRFITLKDEVDFLEPVLERAGEPFILVGHSYGGAVALKVALTFPGRVRAIALYEPTFFSLIEEETSPPNEADGIRLRVVDTAQALERENPERAAEIFIDFWSGPGAWRNVPETQKPAIVRSVRNIRRWGHALFKEPTPLAAFRTLDVPVLYMMGGRTRAPARGVTRLLTGALPRVELVQFGDLGHMAPVTHAPLINTTIARFLSRLG